MIVHYMRCKTCGKEERHGATKPIDALRNPTARAMWTSCDETNRCRFELVGRVEELSDLDRLRLGLREDVKLFGVQ